jgi:hypothetical protein
MMIIVATATVRNIEVFVHVGSFFNHDGRGSSDYFFYIWNEDGMGTRVLGRICGYYSKN